MNTIQIVPHIHNESSGPSHSVPNLSKELINIDVPTSIACLEPGRTVEYVEVESFANISLIRRLGRSPDLYNFLQKKVKENHEIILHNHSLWMFPNFYPGWLKKKNTEIKLVVSPRGTLSQYSRSLSKWKKRIVWPLQKDLLKHADCFHATGKVEYDNIRQFGYKQPIAIIPNGVIIPDLKSYKKNKRKQLLFLGRIHPKKGIEELIKIWSEIQPIHTNWDLNIVGPINNAYAHRMLELSKRLNVNALYFRGEITGDMKNEWYQKSDLFILPTHSENFGIAVAEALANATPVIVTDETPWLEINEKNCGWCVPDNFEIIKETLNHALNSKNLKEMGGYGREWMKNEYSWRSVAVKMKMVYKWLLGLEEKPESIIID